MLETCKATPSPTQIADEANRLSKKILKLRLKLTNLQDLCDHPSASKVAKANTGNYDPGDNSYWRECSCPTCGKVWTEPQ